MKTVRSNSRNRKSSPVAAQAAMASMMSGAAQPMKSAGEELCRRLTARYQELAVHHAQLPHVA